MIANYLPGLLALFTVLLCTFILAGVGAGANADEIRRNEDVSHLWEGRYRGVSIGGYVFSAYAMLLFYKIALTDWPWYLVLAPVAAAGACLCLFGLRFDIRLNLRRLLSRYYLGKDPETASTDMLVQKHSISGRQFAYLKLAGTVLLAAVAVLVSGCAAGRAAQHDSQLSGVTPYISGPTPYISPPNSLHKDAEPEPARRLFGLLPPKKVAPAGPIRIKNKGTLIIQSGTGNTAAGATKPAGPQSAAGNDAVATDNQKAGQRGGAAATGEGSQATSVTKKGGGIPWWVWALVFGLGGAGGWWVRGKASVLSWWPAKLRPG